MKNIEAENINFLEIAKTNEKNTINDMQSNIKNSPVTKKCVKRPQKNLNIEQFKISN